MVIALSQFIVYALINKNLGKEFLGVWSLVVAATSIGQISSFGFSNSLVRYLPEMLLNNEKEDITKMLGTVNFSNFILSLPILFLLYFPAIQYAAHLLNQPQLLIFKSVIPLSMAALFINNLFSVYSYLLDAMQKYYLRSVLQIAGWLFFLFLSILLMPRYRLLGVAIAFFAQSVLQFVIILFIINKRNLLQKVYPVHFDKASFCKVSSFGVKSQLINVLVIFFDPLVKFFITKYIGLTSTGIYEISNKIVMQARKLSVSTNHVIVPKIILHKNAGTGNRYFNQISKRNNLFSISAGMLILLFSPLAVYFFSSHDDNTLMQCVIILNLGWVCNMITSVHYYCCIGLDEIGRLVIYHLILSITVIVFYLGLSYYSPIKLLYFSVPSIALFLGSIYNSYALSKKIEISFSWLKSGLLLYFGLVSFLLLFMYQTESKMTTWLIMPVSFLLYICWILKQYKAEKLVNLNKTDAKN
jgi:O-antigen/teichoic acid export membrane protein